MDRKSSGEDGGSVRLEVVELRRLSATYGSGSTMFEPQSGIEKRDSITTGNSPSPTSQTTPALPAPEKKLTLFALRLAVFEKAATGLGTLGFIWATVVLLGGFAITLDKTDFWFITTILLIEGTRIFSRSHELEWQHQSTWSITGAGISSFRAMRSSSHFVVKKVKALFRPIARVTTVSHDTREVRDSADASVQRNWDFDRKPTRTWKSSDVPIFPYGQWFFVSRNVSKFLYWLQILSATACVVLSLFKLIKHNYGEVEKGDMDKRNRKAALIIFYSLALAEALTFITEKIYWEWKVSCLKLLEQVNNECELGPSGMVSVRRFFYDAYSRCVSGSIFDGLKMDMVSFAMELLDSISPDEQLAGAQILCQFALNDRFSDDTLQKIGTKLVVIERLVEILNWNDPREEEIRKSAAEILSKLAGKKQNSLRVAGIPGAMESISSLLHTNRTSSSVPDEIGERNMVFDHGSYAYWTFNHLGLQILKKLARDHDNCGKIGNTRGLLRKIIDFTHAPERLLKDENATQSQIQTVKRSLQLVHMLASSTGNTGKILRKEISEVVFTFSNIRDILRHGENHPLLQKLGIEILTNLAVDEDATDRIGGTGGIIKELFNIFFNQGVPENHVRKAAGEALAMLALESRSNCRRILKLNVLDKVVTALEVPLVCIKAARILRNLCTYSGEDCFNHLRGVTASAPMVIKAIVSSEGLKLQEIMVGLAAEVFRLMTVQESNVAFGTTGITKPELANALVHILKKYQEPEIKVPRIRRFTIELAIQMMKEDPENIRVFRELELEKELECVLDTTSELESFNIFSGTVGMSRQSRSIHSLVETALDLLVEK